MPHSTPDAVHEVSLRFAGDEAGLDAMHGALASFFQSPGLAAASLDVRLRFETAVAEVVANSLEHALTGERRPIALRLRHERDSIEAMVEDDGAQFEDASAPDPDPLAESGRGLQMVRAAVDSLEYERVEGRNQWIIRLSVSSE